MSSPRSEPGEPTVAALLVLGALLPPGVWLWADLGRPWWLIYAAWFGCIVLVAALRRAR